MRFRIGNTQEQIDAWVRRVEDWHDWFAWRPVRLRMGEWVWLETVQRKGEWHDWDEDSRWLFEYRQK